MSDAVSKSAAFSGRSLASPPLTSAILLMVLISLPAVLPEFWTVNIFVRAMIFGIVALSLTFLAHYGGFISLAQMVTGWRCRIHDSGDGAGCHTCQWLQASLCACYRSCACIFDYCGARHRRRRGTDTRDLSADDHARDRGELLTSSCRPTSSSSTAMRGFAM